jgi:hypothetical protein
MHACVAKTTKVSYSRELQRPGVTPVHACVSPASLGFTRVSTAGTRTKNASYGALIKLCFGVDTVQKLKDGSREQQATRALNAPPASSQAPSHEEKSR